MTFAQMGAEVIRIDPIGGGIDFRRWPVAAEGQSLYWAGLKRPSARWLRRSTSRRSAAPRLGEHSDLVLSEILGLPASEIARLRDARIVAGSRRPVTRKLSAI